MAHIKAPEKLQEFPVSILTNMINLATAGFGVVVALAWNDAIQKFVDQYISPYLGKNSGLISLFLYAIIITILAVFVTMQLSALQRKMFELQDRVTKKKTQDSASSK